MSQLQSLSSEILQIKETTQQSSPASQCFTVSNKATVMTTTRQSLQDFSQSYQPMAEWNKELPNKTWGIHFPMYEQHQYPLQLHHPKSQQNSVSQQQYIEQPCSIPLQQPLQHPTPAQYAMQPSRYAVPLQPHPPQFNTAPRQYTATSPLPQYPQQFRQPRPSRTRQCFYCQQRGPEELCTNLARLRSVYKTPSKTGRRTEDPYLKPCQLAIHGDGRRDPPSDFYFTIHYHPGKDNVDADSLSRKPVDRETAMSEFYRGAFIRMCGSHNTSCGDSARPRSTPYVSLSVCASKHGDWWWTLQIIIKRGDPANTKRWHECQRNHRPLTVGK